RAYWLVNADDRDNPIVRLPVPWVTPTGGDALGPEHYILQRPGDPTTRLIPAEMVVDFGDWEPTSLYGGSAAIDALRDILYEQVSAAEYRRQMWERGGRVSAVLKRPKDAPNWSAEAAERFREDWRAKWT